MNYAEAFQANLISRTFTMYPARDHEFSITFLADGTTSTGHDWQVGVSPSNGQAILQIAKNGVLEYRMNLRRGGVFEGKASRGGAHTMRPSGGEVFGDWEHLETQRTYRDYLDNQAIANPEAMMEALPDPFEWELHKKAFDQPKDTSVTPIVLFTYDRKEYAINTLEALAAANKENLPLYLFMDLSSHPALQGIRQEIVDRARELFLEVNFFAWPVRCGEFRNKIWAKQQIFDHLGFNQAFFFDDDLVVSSSYVKICENLLSWSNQFTNVAGVQAWSRESTYEGATSKSVRISYEDYFGVLQTRDGWEAIKPLIQLFYDTWLIGPEIDNLPYIQIQQWVDHHKKDYALEEGFGDSPFSHSTYSRAERMTVWTRNHLAGDLVYNTQLSSYRDLERFALICVGWVYLQTSLSRAEYIGKFGTTEDGDSYTGKNYHNVSLKKQAGDHLIKNFEPQTDNLVSSEDSSELVEGVV